MRFWFIVSLGTIAALVIGNSGMVSNMPYVKRLQVKHVDSNMFNAHNGHALTYFPKYDSTDPLLVEHKMGQSDPYQQQHANWLSSQQHHQHNKQHKEQKETYPLTGMPVWFDHQVFHVVDLAKLQQVPKENTQMTITRRTTPASRLKKRNSQVKHFHDIFSRYEAPDKVAFGHIEQGPQLFEQRFESVNKGTRYKGDIKWYDPAGGYGVYHWNLAQGKLS